MGTVLVATDTNPLYCDFIPSFVKAWRALIPEADICIVLIAHEIPDRFTRYSKYIRLFPPIEGLHTAFQAQCIRLLYPRCITRDEGVLITDMDMLPMRRTYYTDPIASVSNDAFVVYRDLCLPIEIPMCYNIAHPSTWASMFGTEDTANVLRRWYQSTNYDGNHGGSGWGTDQIILVKMFNEWNGTKKVLNDTITRFGRLDRTDWLVFADKQRLREQILRGDYVDYHCMRPYKQHREINDFVVDCLQRDNMKIFSFCLYGPENPKYYGGMIENIRLISQHFPSWKVFVYCGSDVSDAYKQQLASHSNVVVRETGKLGEINMLYRFFAIDEPGVSLMMVRDADSRVHWKDRWAIQEFVRSDHTLHIIRDHEQHTAPILGGLWGMRKVDGVFLSGEYLAYKEDKSLGHRWAHDQNFLADVMYPRFLKDSLVHYSNNQNFVHEYAVEFPFTWSNDIYCGKVEEGGFLDKPARRIGLALPIVPIRIS